jgi:hypothetical protein
MAATPSELVASQAFIASGNSVALPLSTASLLVATVNFTAGSGTISGMDLWFQASADGGTTWFDLPADLVLKTSSAAGGNTTTANQRNIVAGKTTTTAEQFIGIFKHVAANRVRAKWVLTGTSPSLSFSVNVVAK